jgi:hypothetical protein
MTNTAEEGKVMRRQTAWRTLLAAEALDSSAEKRPLAGVVGPSHHHHHHAYLWSRRRFLQAGGMLVGAAVSVTVLGGTAGATHRGTGIPSPVPGFSPGLKQAFGVEVPFFGPRLVDPFAAAAPSPLADPLLINDFYGVFGLIEADGVSDNNSDGVDRLWACDVRFMSGVFVDRQGRRQRGTFGFF